MSDLKILWRMVFPNARGSTHAERLDGFYRSQAEGYDDFRRRLLHGREPMMRALPVADGATLLDMGGGTGSNLEYLDLGRMGRVTIVDLSTALLEVARARIAQRGWTNVRAVCADAAVYEPPEGPVDIVTFSYSLTMMPEWKKAIDHARSLLKPAGIIGVTDFYVSPERHSWPRRAFWKLMFGWDRVWVSPAHLDYLRSTFELLYVDEQLGSVPYMMGIRSPYYVFIGRR